MPTVLFCWRPQNRYLNKVKLIVPLVDVGVLHFYMILVSAVIAIVIVIVDVGNDKCV